MKFGFEQPLRLKKIEEIRREAIGPTYPVTFQGTLQYLPVRTVSIELPMYRLNNGRTEAAQLEYLAQNPGVNQDLFRGDRESESAQRAQHQILSTLIDEKGLLQYFRDHSQEEPLILTHDGFVLNGNRRLCTMRTLFKEAPKAFERFANIQVVILPSGDEKDLDRLESRLQREQDLRADYPWYADAVKYRERLESFDANEDTALDEVAAMEEVSKRDIIAALEMLRLAEAYLNYIGAPQRYSRLSANKAGGGDSRYAFESLVKGRAKFKDEADREAFTYLCFAEMRDPKGSNYRILPKVADYLDDIKLDIPIPLPESEANKAANGENVIDELFGPAPTIDKAPLVSYLKNPKNEQEVRDVVQKVVKEQDFIKSDEKTQTYVLEQVRKAVTLLAAAINGIRDTSSTSGVAQQLASIDENAAKIREWLSSKQ